MQDRMTDPLPIVGLKVCRICGRSTDNDRLPTIYRGTQFCSGNCWKIGQMK